MLLKSARHCDDSLRSPAVTRLRSLDAASLPFPFFKEPVMPGHNGGSNQPAPPARGLSCVVLPLGFLVLVAAGVYLISHLPAGHWLRVLGVLVPLVLGFWLTVALVRHQKAMAGLVALAVGGVLAALAWWFVPTAQGLSLRSAQQENVRLVAELRDLPAGATAGYQKNQDQRATLVEQYPEFRPELEEAEKAWVERSRAQWLHELEQLPLCDLAAFRTLTSQYKGLPDLFLGKAEEQWVRRSQEQWQKEVTALKAGDFARFQALRATYDPFLDERLQTAEMAWFERTYRELPPGDFAAAGRARALLRHDLTSDPRIRLWQANWVGRTVDAALKETDRLVKTDPVQASKQLIRLSQNLEELGKFPDLQRRILDGRRQAVQASLETTRQDVRSRIAADRFQEAANRADHLVRELGEEAQAVGLQEEIVKFRDSYRFLADLARQAGKQDPKP
jgi:hypothetical protein